MAPSACQHGRADWRRRRQRGGGWGAGSRRPGSSREAQGRVPTGERMASSRRKPGASPGGPTGGSEAAARRRRGGGWGAGGRSCRGVCRREQLPHPHLSPPRSAGAAAPRSSARGRRCSRAVAPSPQRSRSCGNGGGPGPGPEQLPPAPGARERAARRRGVCRPENASSMTPSARKPAQARAGRRAAEEEGFTPFSKSCCECSASACHCACK